MVSKDSDLMRDGEDTPEGVRPEGDRAGFAREQAI